MSIVNRFRASVIFLLMTLVIVAFASCGGGGKTILPPPNDNGKNQTNDLPIIDLTPPVLAENPGDIGGIVKDAMGYPVGDVEIAVDDAEISAMTGDDGTFLISEVAGGSHTLTFSKDGHVLFTKDVVVDGDSPTNLTFTSRDTRSTSGVDNPSKLHGLVYEDGTDNPIQGAWVIVFDYEGFFRVTRSGDNGRYSFDMLPPGSHQVLAFKRGFKVYFGSVTLIGGENTEKNIPLVRINTGNVAGRVTNPEGNGIVGASVFLLSYHGEGYGSKFHTFTNAEGFYKFESVPAGEADMLAAHRHYKPESATVTVIQGQTIEQNFQLQPKDVGEFAVLEGVVKNTSGAPIVGALIKLRAEGNQLWQTESRENGHYRIELPHPGNYKLTAIKQGYYTFEQDIVLNPGGNEKNIVLEPVGQDGLGKVKGRAYLVDPNHPDNKQIAPNALVHLWGIGDRDGTDFETRTNSDGYYVFEGVPAGKYLLHAVYEGYKAFEAELHVGPGSVIVKDIYFHLDGDPPQGYGKIFVIVRDQFQAPIEGAIVKVWFNNLEGDLFAEKATGADGIAKFFEVPAPGAYAVKAFKWERSSQVAEVTLEPNAIAEVHLTIERPVDGGTGTLFGRVQNAHLDFGWIKGALVKVYQGDLVIADATTNAEGYYAIDGLPAGTYRVRFSKEGFVTRWYEQVVIVAGHETELNAELFPDGGGKGVLFGHVRNSVNEAAIPEALVKVFANEQQIAYAYTNVDGYYIIDGIPAGTYNVRFTHPSYNNWWAEGVVITEGGETKQNALLTPLGGGDKGVLFGHVKNGHNQALLAGVGVKVYQGDAVVADAVTNGEGYYAIDGLAAGTYAAKFFKDGFNHRWYEQIVIVAGQHTERNAELFPVDPPANGVLFGRVRNAANQALLNEVKVTIFQNDVQKRQIYTNVDGYYITDGLPAGYYAVRFSKVGFETYWAYEVQIIGGGETELNANLTPVGEPQYARMYGHVRNLEEQPLPGAYVKLGHFVGEEYVVDYSAVAGEAGYYVIEGIAPGMYVLRAIKDGYQMIQDEIGFEAGDNKLININMHWQG